MFFYKLIQGAALTANHYFGSGSVNFPAISNILLSSHSGKVALFDVFRFIQILLRANANIRGTQRQFSENICSEDDLRSRIFGTCVVKFLACMPVLGFSNI